MSQYLACHNPLVQPIVWSHQAVKFVSLQAPEIKETGFGGSSITGASKRGGEGVIAAVWCAWHTSLTSITSHSTSHSTSCAPGWWMKILYHPLPHPPWSLTGASASRPSKFNNFTTSDVVGALNLNPPQTDTWNMYAEMRILQRQGMWMM